MMTTLLSSPGLAIAAGLLLSGVHPSSGPPLSNLYVNGRMASTAVIDRNGTPYVPLKDVARALDLVVNRRSDGYELIKAGGANQVRGLTGRIGDDLFDGRFRFQVLRVEKGEKYRKQYDRSNDTVEAPRGQIFFVVHCRIKNGTPRQVLMDLFGKDPTALADDQGRSHERITGVWADLPGRAVSLLPGAGAEFALTFVTPPDTVAKDLIYTPNEFPTHTFRVSLTER